MVERNSETITSAGSFASEADNTKWFYEVRMYVKEKKLEETKSDPCRISSRAEQCFKHDHPQLEFWQPKGQEMYSLLKNKFLHFL